MTRFLKISLLTFTLVGLSACSMSEGIDNDSSDGTYTITHTTKGTLYWE